MLAVTQELFQKKKNAPKVQVRLLKMPQEDPFPTQAVDYKSETQLETTPPTDSKITPQHLKVQKYWKFY